ncbi:beta-ketoacyl-[acyl-carrier-protein] synthase family protein [Streptomyces sp. NPDC055239]
MSRDVVVTGIGLVTPAGIGVAENWRRVCAGKPTAAHNAELDGLDVDFACTISGFNAEPVIGSRKAWRMDRCTQIAVVAAAEALADAGLDPSSWDGARVGVVIGGTVGGCATVEAQHHRLLNHQSLSPMFLPAALVNMVAGEIAMQFKAGGPNLVTSAACASGAMALGIGRMLLAADMCDVVLTGGSEAGVTPLFVSGFARMGALSKRRDDPAAASRPFDADRDGFVMGEGAGVVVLEQGAHARARGAHVHAVLSGFAATDDAHHPTAPEPSGAAVERAIRTALADADVSAADVDHVNAHGTSTPYNDLAEARVLRRTLGGRACVTSTKGVTGHLLSAAGAVEAAYCVLAIKHGIVPPTANLDRQDTQIDLDIARGAPRRLPVRVAMSNSFGFGGHNAVVVVTAP